MEAWDLGPEDIHEVNEEAVIVRLSGFGQTGPEADRSGYGTIAEGVSGWAAANGFPDREPLLPSSSLADAIAALFAVQSALLTVYERDIGRGGSGRGQIVDVSLAGPPRAVTEFRRAPPATRRAAGYAGAATNTG